MSCGQPTVKVLCGGALLSIVAALIPLHVHANELEQRLRNEYTDKTLVVRGFYQGQRLGVRFRGHAGKGLGRFRRLDGGRICASRLSKFVRQRIEHGSGKAADGGRWAGL